MSSLASSEEAPFVFGAYASHLNEVAAPSFTLEAEDPEVPLLSEVEADPASLPTLNTRSPRR